MVIHTTPLDLTIAGFGATALNRDYAATAFRLSGRMWDIVKKHQLKNEGKNVWVYGENHHVFAGVVLVNPNEAAPLGLETMHIKLPKYAYHKHVGPYNQIGQAGQKMRAELIEQGFEIVMPYVEIYGHWDADETKLETELIMAIT
jgi:predicted transcriptional regulator YdeE